MLLNISYLWPFAIVGILIRLWFTGRRPRNYPPGPPTLPIIGNLHQVSSIFQTSRKYGLADRLSCRCPPVMPIFSLRNGHASMVRFTASYLAPKLWWCYQVVREFHVRTACETYTDFVHTPLGKAVKDLLDKRSGIYSHRPDLYIGQTLCSGGLRVLMMVSELLE